MLAVTSGGDYWGFADDTAGCLVLSDTVNIVEILTGKIGVTIVDDTVGCEGDTLEFIAASLHTNYVWNGGLATGPSIDVTQSGDYFVNADFNGCPTVSDTITVSIEPIPPKPTILANDTALFVVPAPGANYEWYYNGNLIPGANFPGILPIGDGMYTVICISPNGCASPESDAYAYSATGIFNLENAWIQLTPNPASEVLQLNFLNNDIKNLRAEILNVAGQVISTYKQIVDQQILDISDLSPGMYWVKVRSDDKLQVIPFNVLR